MPGIYRTYYKELSDEAAKAFERAAAAKSQSRADSTDVIDSKIAFDLADRVSKMHDIDIAEELRGLLAENSKEFSALLLSKDIAQGKYHTGEIPVDERLDLAVRVGLAIVTEGVTMAPIEGISEVTIKQNQDGTRYLSVSIAGPMRSAGGTESAITMLIADHVRKAVGLDKYQATSFDDEPGRFVEELRVYERDAQNFQYHVSDEDIKHVISNIPVELDGVDTDNFEVVNHRNMKRIKTDKVRGGALRVLNDGLIGRSKKILKRIERYDLDGWEWLSELRGAIQVGNDSADKTKEDTGTKRMREVLTGRSVLSMPGRPGGFRLRYGRSCNTGFAAIGFHPVIAEILDHTITVGTQIKTDIPGKGASAAFVDSIDTPTVRLDDGSVVKIKDVGHGVRIKRQIVEILHLGDVLISFGDFIENNAQLKPSGYVEEYWIEELRHFLQQPSSSSSNAGRGSGNDAAENEGMRQRLAEYLTRPPTAEESISASLEFGIPLYPKYLHFWDELQPADLESLLNPDAASESEIRYDNCSLGGTTKKALEKAGVPHLFAPCYVAQPGKAESHDQRAADVSRADDMITKIIQDDDDDDSDTKENPPYGNIIIKDAEAKILFNLLFRVKPSTQTINEAADGGDTEAAIGGGNHTVPKILSACGIPIRVKSSAYIGVRMGRPEKASPRDMKPPTHLLFPVGEKGGATRDLIKASKGTDDGSIQVDISNRLCPKCRVPVLSLLCPECGTESVLTRQCPHCREKTKLARCERCRRKTVLYASLNFPLKAQLLRAQERLEMRAQEPLKGVKGLLGEDMVAEPIEKGLIRQKFGLSIFKDGTVRYDASNSPLTHFKPSWIGTAVKRLVELGYTHDVDGRPLVSEDQIVELRMQDIIISYDNGRYLLAAAKYVDMLLSKLHRTEPYYNAKTIQDMTGHLIIGLAPHTSVGVVGRIIGFAETHVCFATPNWHSAKRRDADGDADSIMLLMDALLNFSRSFLSRKIGGHMDVPLLVQPLVLPYESQPQAHNLEVTKSFPLEFFEATMRGSKAGDVDSVEIVESRLSTERQFYDYHFTHGTSTLTTSRSRSAYSVLGSMLNKLDLQLKNAEMIRAVDPNETVLNIITTHLVPDMAGNLRAYASQTFRCTECGKKYRRMPLTLKCSKCNLRLTPNITRPGVEKYLTLTKSLAKRYDIGKYHHGRIAVLADELSLVFGKSRGDQSMLSDFV